MGRWRRTTACERAARWISLELDGELAELERDGLARHVGRCEPCRALAADIGAFTALMRSSPAVAREPLTLVRRRPAPLRRLARKGVPVGALVATLAVAGAMFVLPHSSGTSVSAFEFGTRRQQIQYVRAENARVEPAGLLRATIWPQLRPPPLL